MSRAARRVGLTYSAFNICCNYFVFGNIRILTRLQSAYGDSP